jgi:hypothetical protein
MNITCRRIGFEGKLELSITSFRPLSLQQPLLEIGGVSNV